MTPRPVLGEIELEKVQSIIVDGDQVLVEHGVPALEGDFLQRLGRRATQINLRGFLTGSGIADALKALRDKFHAAEPVPFVTDIATATQVDEVLIEEMAVRELAGKPARFEYAFLLREFIPAPPTRRIEPPFPPPPPPPPQVDTGTLIVEVIVEGEPNFDFNQITVTAQGTQEDGSPFALVLTNREGNIWTEQEFPLGEFTIEAVVIEPQAMSGSKPAVVRAGETTQVQIVLQPGTTIAKSFVVHFNNDKAFIEPCMRLVMQQVAEYAQAHADQKLIIIGHTDLVGSAKYNLSLSERRARSAYAYLSFGRDRDLALAEWNTLRHKRPTGVLPSINDTWNTREYQYILQDLGHYLGNINGKHDDLTDSAVREFQTDRSLTVDGDVGDGTWVALIEAYLEQDPLSVPESQFFSNCDGEILKWLGCSEQDPVKNTQDAWRPNRRTEFLFVKADSFPCEIPLPDTFDLPEPGVVGSGWCLGPGDPNKRCCFITRDAEQEDKWLIQPAVPGTITVRGSIKFSDGTPAPDVKYVLSAADGEFMDGERSQGSKRGDGTPAKTQQDGVFSYPDKPKGIGIYTLQIEGDFVAFLEGQSLEEVKGSSVCKDLDGSSDLEIVVTSREVAGIVPSIIFELPESFAPDDGGLEGATLSLDTEAVPSLGTPKFVVVKKDYTSPRRRPITLKVDELFDGFGELTFEQDGGVRMIRFFKSRDGDDEITLENRDNEFSADQLLSGHTIFAEGAFPSGTIQDTVELTLSLKHEVPPNIGFDTQFVTGRADKANMIAVELSLDIPIRFDEVPPTLPPINKVNPGRVIMVSSPARSQRVPLRIAVTPLDFPGTLVVREVVFVGDPALEVSLPLQSESGKVGIFENEEPQPTGETPIELPHEFIRQDLPINGTLFFIEGNEISDEAREIGFQLGIKDVAHDGDRVALTVMNVEMTTSSSIVIVKKPHTNPARRAINLRTITPLEHAGTVSGDSGLIRLFTTATGSTEIDSDLIFTGDQLPSGIQVFAEGVAHSQRLDDFRLTLTILAGNSLNTPVLSVPTTMTAVELTLDIAVSRITPGVDPAPLSAADKINFGRFVQVADPGHTHERAMLIVRQAQPAAFDGELELKAIGPRVALFEDEKPVVGQNELIPPRFIQNSSIPANGHRLFVEGENPSIVARDAGFQLGIRDIEADGDRVNITVIQIEIAATAVPAAPAITFVRFGLWDNAFRGPGAPGGPIFNNQAEADNFAGADTRRFHIRVRDISTRGSRHIQIDWFTRDRNNSNLDAPAVRDITLIESPANSGVFISRGLLLVTDRDDQNQATHSGMPAGFPDAGASQGTNARNHRTRRGDLRGSMRMEYHRVAGVNLPLQLPIFRRNPEDRRRMPLQIFVLRVAAGGAGVISTAAVSTIWTRDLRVIRETYARTGIEVDTVVAPGTPAADIVRVGSDSLVLLAPPAGVNPLTVRFQPVNDESTIAAAAPSIANTIRVFYTGGLVSGNRGESWPDANFAGQSQVGTSFINGVSAGPYTVAHEIGHLLTNKSATVNTGHYRAPAVPVANRLRNDQNLMRNGTSVAEGVTESKRIWDANDGDGLNHFTAIRGSRFTRNF